MKNNNVIFNSFMDLLLNPKTIKEAKSKNLTVKDYIYDNKRFDIWFCSKGIGFENENLNAKLSDAEFAGHEMTYIGNVGALRLEDVFSEDGLPSEQTYQEILNIPASAYIFSNYQYPTSCRIRKDYNYQGFNYYVADTSNRIINKHLTLDGITSNYARPYNNYDITDTTALTVTTAKNAWKQNSAYFAQEYNFSSGYNVDEYATYNIESESLLEDQINLTTNSSKFIIPPDNVVGGALLFSWYNGPRQSYYNLSGKLTTMSAYNYTIINDKGEEETIEKPLPVVYPSFPSASGNCIPVCYMELPKTYNLKDAVLDIQWSENGIFSLK